MVICAFFTPFFLSPDDQVDEGNESDCRTAIPAHNNLAAFSDNDNQALVADR